MATRDALEPAAATVIGRVANALNEADTPSSPVVRFATTPLPLDSGHALRDLQVAYQTYGELDANHANAILVCHALTGDQHVANTHPVTGKPGWWQLMV